ncbi:MAG: DUF29 family protein [Lamprocystis purpurea]|nr:DUF29 family protein [Lamprocystis purpurea]
MASATDLQKQSSALVLLKWKYQPERRGAGWDKTIKAQRQELAYALDESPSLRGKLTELHV